jgi:hypothetical protein
MAGVKNKLKQLNETFYAMLEEGDIKGASSLLPALEEVAKANTNPKGGTDDQEVDTTGVDDRRGQGGKKAGRKIKRTEIPEGERAQNKRRLTNKNRTKPTLAPDPSPMDMIGTQYEDGSMMTATDKAAATTHPFNNGGMVPAELGPEQLAMLMQLLQQRGFNAQP